MRSITSWGPVGRLYTRDDKYSYGSHAEKDRVIRIGTRNPYDPGFKLNRFAIDFQNFGVGLDEQEKSLVFTPGFRARAARREYPHGAGIGLSEVKKIMEAHRGSVKLKSKILFDNEEGTAVSLTTVTLVFPSFGSK